MRKNRGSRYQLPFSIDGVIIDHCFPARKWSYIRTQTFRSSLTMHVAAPLTTDHPGVRPADDISYHTGRLWLAAEPPCSISPSSLHGSPSRGAPHARPADVTQGRGEMEETETPAWEAVWVRRGGAGAGAVQ